MHAELLGWFCFETVVYGFFLLGLSYFLPYLRTKTLACFFIVLLVTLSKCGQQEAVLIKYQLNCFYYFKCKPKLFFAKTNECESRAGHCYVLQKACMIIDLCKSASLCEDCRPYNVSKTTQCHILAANFDPDWVRQTMQLFCAFYLDN